MGLERIRQALAATFVGSDCRVVTLALARAADSFGNMFLLIVIPLYIAIGPVDVQPLLGVQVPVVGISLTEALLIGVLLSLFGFLSSFGQPFVGLLSDQTDRRRAYILLGLALLTVANAAFAFVTDYRLLIGLRMLQGIGAAFTIPCTAALVSELSSDEDRGGNFGVYNTFRLIGVGFGPIVAGVIIGAGSGRIAEYSFALAGRVVEMSGFDAAFFVAAASALVSFLLVTLFVSDPAETRASASQDLSIAVRGSDSGQLLDPVFVVGVATLFMALGLTLFATLQPIINERLGQGGTLFAVEFAAAAIANIVFQVPIGRASDRYGRRPFLIAGCAIFVPSILVQGFVFSPLMMILARFIQGIGIALVFAPGLAFAGDLAQEGGSSTRLAVVTMAFGLGTALGPLAAGFLVGYGVVVPFAVSAILGMCGLVLVYTQVFETIEEEYRTGEEPDATV
ncbi:MFS transporter [Haladaptatus halobius]|uniref:MFS transporter n=1 Tax=Haladaptatus halobius TaxID=2884875 RepID=UPI001D09A546|nr:MFS transporter [Haladaptatus halobius]